MALPKAPPSQSGEFNDDSHIVINGFEGGRLECLHCGDTYSPTMPCSMGIYGAILSAWSKDHESCVLISKGRRGDAPMPGKITVVKTGYDGPCTQ